MFKYTLVHVEVTDKLARYIVSPEVNSNFITKPLFMKTSSSSVCSDNSSNASKTFSQYCREISALLGSGLYFV